MNFIDKISKICVCDQKKDISVGKIVFKTIAITTAVLAFVPSVIKINKGKGFDAYGLLSHVKYEKNTDENGKLRRDISISLIDLSRYGIGTNDEIEEEIDENSISIEK